jgi:beta-glucosidase
MVTLHHFTNPVWLADRGGWRSPEVVPRLAAYAERVGRDLGDLVRWWVTINEPSILGLKAYLEGSWPPHRPGDLRGAVRVLRYAARAHAAARQALRASRSDALASLAFAMWPLEPRRPWSPIDQLMASLGEWLWHGRVVRDTARAIDWVGVNYYSRVRVGWPPVRDEAAADPHAGAGNRTDFGWEIYPAGLFNVLRRVGRLGKPVFVTENGISDADDDQRPSYIVEHVRQLHRALRAGVDVRGYMHWSLMDNFEWAEGYTQRFGLVAVDFTTQQRTPRPSAFLYRDIAQANALSASVAEAPA